MHAKLPKNLEERLIADMKVGEYGWTVPWAMWADRHGALWLNGKYTVDETPGGTVAMQILRVPDGYHVDIRQCPDERWTPEGGVYVGGSHPVPVLKLITPQAEDE